MRAFLDRVDRLWTRVEVALCLALLAALMVALLTWVVVKGLSARTTETYFAGAVLRMLALAVAAGVPAFRLLVRAPRFRAIGTLAAVVLGAGLGFVGRDVGTAYFSNVLGWLQDGSSLTLVGGLRGLGTRLTLSLVLVGGSLATASGRHVSIDLATRALGDSLKRPLALFGGVCAAAVCFFSAWGFFDYCALDAFKAAPGAPVSAKLSAVSHGAARQFFLWRRQVALDARMLPRVLAGEKWDSSLTAADWNEWLAAGDWAAYVTADEVQALHDLSAPTMTRSPLATLPGEPARGLLVKGLNLILPLGLWVLALRFLLWVLRGGPQEDAHGAPGAPVAAGPAVPE